MKLKNPLVAAILLGMSSQSANALIIDIDYSYDSNNFFSSQTRKDILEAAANYFETRISDSLLPIVSTPGGNSFLASFTDPSTASPVELSNYSEAADTITIFTGGRNLGSSTLGQGGPGGYGISYFNISYVDDVVSRGQGNGTAAAVRGSSAYDFATWGGGISFNTTSDWYFDDDVSTDEAFSGYDFFSVALHEIAHVLGFGTADSWNSYVIEDLLTGDDFFTGADSVASYGGDVPLNAGQDHWDSSTQSDGVQPAMSPSIGSGVRKRMTSLDIAGLRDVGWEMSATVVPVPGSAWLFGSALLGMIGWSRRKAV